MLVTNLIQEPQVWASMCRRFPWVAEERGDIGEGLVHLEFAALRRGVEKAADSNDVSVASQILAFVEELLQRPNLLHPEVLDAIEVSFIEDLYLAEPHQRDFAFSLLPAATRQHWNEIAGAHERHSG